MYLCGQKRQSTGQRDETHVSPQHEHQGRDASQSFQCFYLTTKTVKQEGT